MDTLLNLVKNAIMNHTAEQQQNGYDPSGLLGHVENLFSQHQQGQFGNLRPASEDPYGDPADQEQPRSAFSNLRPASQDPYGDPADKQATASRSRFGNLRPASEDPYGDPADQG